MNVDDLLGSAWGAVQKAGIPPELRALALKEAIDFLRAQDGDTVEEPRPGGSGSGESKTRQPSKERKEEGNDVGPPTEGEFFERLASESGVSEQDLRDVIRLTKAGKVEILTPTKDLGSSTTEQARNVIALVASGRDIGLLEKPVQAAAIREELERKRCYDSNNFAAKHLGPLKGFNAGSNRTEIVLSSKWVTEFQAAVEKAHGRTDTG